MEDRFLTVRRDQYGGPGPFNRILRMMYTVMILAAVPGAPRATELVMAAHGTASLAPYVGVRERAGLTPAYRGEFLAHIDFLRRGNIVLTGIAGNATAISRTDSTVFNLERLRYTLAPGIRVEFPSWIARLSFHHESVYAISREEGPAGAFWQNSVRAGIGTRGAYMLFLPLLFNDKPDFLLDSWDASITGGAFLHGSQSIWSARNHDYRYEVSGLLRYHPCVIGGWLMVADSYQHFWVSADDFTERTWRLTLSFFRHGSGRLFGLFASYTPVDTNVSTAEERFGALGIRLVF